MNKQNARAKASGGYQTMSEIIKNKHADVYYRKAIEAETEKMLATLFSRLEAVYTTIHTENALPTGKKPSIRNVEKLVDYFKGEYFEKFMKNSTLIVRKYVTLAVKKARGSIAKAMRKMYGDDFVLHVNKEEVEQIMSLIVRRNIGLIQNTTSQTLNNIENIVFDGVTTGQSWRTIAKDLSNQTDIAKNRIKRIARDQTAKANEALNELSQRSAGIEFFEWRTAQDERVSEGYGGHKQLNGKIYKWGDVEHYPIIDSYGHRGLPKERVNCRCTALGILLRKDYEARQLSDGSYEIVRGKI